MRGVSAVVGVSRVTCEQRGAGGGAHRGGGVEGAQPHRGGGQPGHVALGTWHQSLHCSAPVNVGGPGGGVARHGEVPPAQVICQQQHHVGPRPLPRPAIWWPVVSAPADIIILSSSLHQARLGCCCRGSLLIGKRNDFNKMTLRQKVCELIKIKLCGVLGADSGLCLQSGE